MLVCFLVDLRVAIVENILINESVIIFVDSVTNNNYFLVDELQGGLSKTNFFEKNKDKK
tara:strand:+ start:7817 stop:7993 length:177 start_codon:yes stop_codon:yes gene_type:complete